MFIAWFLSESLWKVTNAQESLVAFSWSVYWLTLFKLPETLYVIVGKRKRGGKNLKLNFPLLVVEQGFQCKFFLENNCPSFYLLLFQASPSQRDCETAIAITQIFNDWFHPIMVNPFSFASEWSRSGHVTPTWPLQCKKKLVEGLQERFFSLIKWKRWVNPFVSLPLLPSLPPVFSLPCLYDLISCFPPLNSPPAFPLNISGVFRALTLKVSASRVQRPQHYQVPHLQVFTHVTLF